MSRSLRLLNFTQWSVVPRVVVACVVIGLAFAGATTGIGYSKASAGLGEQGEARLESEAGTVTTAVDLWITQHLELAHAVASMPVAQRFLEARDAGDPADFAAIQELALSFKASISDVTGLSLLDAEGISRYSVTATTIGTNLSNRDYYQSAIKGNDFVSGVSRTISDGSPRIFIGTPVRTADGRIVGVLNASGDPTGLQKLLDTQQQRNGGAGKGLLVDEQGLIIANTVDPSWLLRPVVALSPAALNAAVADKRWGNSTPPEPIGEQGLAPSIGVTSRMVFTWQSEGSSYHAVAVPLTRTGWTFVAALPTASFDAAAQDLLRTSALAVMVGLLLVIGLIVWLMRPIAFGLRTLTGAASRLAEGNIDEDVTLSGNDEMGQMAGVFREVMGYLRGMSEVANAIAAGDLSHDVRLASEHDSLGQAFDRMRTGLRALVGELQQTAEGVAETSASVKVSAAQTGIAVQQVSTAVQNVASGAQDTSHSAQETNISVSQLSQAIDGIAHGASDQAQQVQKARGTATQVSAGVDIVADKASSVATASMQTKASARHGADAVRETVSGMVEIKAVVVEAAAKVNELGKLGQRIGQVVETIDDIAEQTNLLALNAAIEAARAGEHGRGFAVVADEVRKLAERSGRETKQIADLIREVQGATLQAVAAMESGATKVEQGSAKADLAGRALADIMTAVEGTVEQVTEIASSAQEMAAASRSVVEAMESISAVVEENTASTEQMAAQATQVARTIENIAATSREQGGLTVEVSASTDEMSSQVHQLSEQAEELAATAEQLRRLVARFKLEDTLVRPTDSAALRRAA
jgi:methyl-accepting chemotaxis protein